MENAKNYWIVSYLEAPLAINEVKAMQNLNYLY